MGGLWNSGKSWRAIGALRFADLYKTLPTIMFNYGQSLEDEGGQFAGVGVEFSSDAIDVFVEATSEIPEDQEFKAFIGDGYTPRARVSPGVRTRPSTAALLEPPEWTATSPAAETITPTPWPGSDAL